MHDMESEGRSQILALSLISCVILHEFLQLSELEFPHMQSNLAALLSAERGCTVLNT